MTNHRIMLIDDNKDDCEVIMRAFQACNADVPIVLFHETEKGLDYLLNDEHPLPSLILLDLNIPGMDGRMFLQHIKSHRQLRGVPVIIMTTSSDEKDIASCYRHGAGSYVQKSIYFHDMKKHCRAIIDYWFDTCLLPERTH